jgi:hypothetical protein
MRLLFAGRSGRGCWLSVQLALLLLMASTGALTLKTTNHINHQSRNLPCEWYCCRAQRERLLAVSAAGPAAADDGKYSGTTSKYQSTNHQSLICHAGVTAAGHSGSGCWLSVQQALLLLMPSTMAQPASTNQPTTKHSSAMRVLLAGRSGSGCWLSVQQALQLQTASTGAPTHTWTTSKGCDERG